MCVAGMDNLCRLLVPSDTWYRSGVGRGLLRGAPVGAAGRVLKRSGVCCLCEEGGGCVGAG